MCDHAPMRIAVTADHNGVALKDILSRAPPARRPRGRRPRRRGGRGDRRLPSALRGRLPASLDGHAGFAIVIGGGGSGETIACNKLAGIRAVTLPQRLGRRDRSRQQRRERRSSSARRSSSPSSPRRSSRPGSRRRSRASSMPPGSRWSPRSSAASHCCRNWSEAGGRRLGRLLCRRHVPVLGAGEAFLEVAGSRGRVGLVTAGNDERRELEAHQRLGRRPGDGVAVEESFGHLADQGGVGDGVTPRVVLRERGVVRSAFTQARRPGPARRSRHCRRQPRRPPPDRAGRRRRGARRTGRRCVRR